MLDKSKNPYPFFILFVKNWKWDGYQTADTKGNTYSLQINTPIAPNVTLEAGTKGFDTGTDVLLCNKILFLFLMQQVFAL